MYLDPEEPKLGTYSIFSCNTCHISVIQFSNSHDMLNQQKQEMARSVPDPFSCEGLGSGDKTRVLRAPGKQYNWLSVPL